MPSEYENTFFSTSLLEKKFVILRPIDDTVVVSRTERAEIIDGSLPDH
jgi:hypothetical protein